MNHVDSDIALIADYLAGELPLEEVDALEGRHATDEAFREKVQALIDSWYLEIPFDFWDVSHLVLKPRVPRTVTSREGMHITPRCIQRAVINRRRDRLRRGESRRAKSDRMDPVDVGVGVPDWDDPMNTGWAVAIACATADALHQMADRDREVWLLLREHGQMYEEVAEALGIDERAVHTHLASALGALHRLVTDESAVIRYKEVLMDVDPEELDDEEFDSLLDDDISLISDYLSAELPVSLAFGVKNRLATDAAFRKDMAFVVASWYLPVRFDDSLLPPPENPVPADDVSSKIRKFFSPRFVS